MRRHLIALLALLAPRVLHAHAGQPLAPHDFWRAWELDPGVALALVLLAVIYAVGVRRMPRGHSRGRRVACFLAAWFVLVVALISPLHALGGALFSAHMAQHELLVTVAAPLLVLASPGLTTMWSLPPGARRRVGTWLRDSGATRAGTLLVSPLVAWVLHAAALWLWHLPGPYQATLRNDAVHAMQHLSFFGTALLFWWSVIDGARVRRGLALVSLFTTMLHTGALGVVLAFAERLWYPAYATTTVAWGLPPLEDQQMGGLIMWIPGGVAYLLAALAVIWRALRERESHAHRWVPQAAALVLVVIAAAACDRHDDTLPALVGGDATHGRELIRRYGCGSCHTIPGVRGANALVGPPLAGIARRVYVGGVVTNTPDNLVQWIQDPKSIDDKTAMPNVGVSRADAIDIASYLYTLK